MRIDAILLDSYIRQARAASSDDSDECAIETLTTWQATALANMNAGITVTAVSFAGQSTSGEISAASDQLMRICEMAINRINGHRHTAATLIRNTGYAGT